MPELLQHGGDVKLTGTTSHANYRENQSNGKAHLASTAVYIDLHERTGNWGDRKNTRTGERCAAKCRDMRSSAPCARPQRAPENFIALEAII